MAEMGTIKARMDCDLGIAGAVTEIANLARQPQVLELDKGPYARTVLVCDGHGPGVVGKYETDKMPQRVVLDTVPDFTDYICAEALRRGDEWRTNPEPFEYALGRGLALGSEPSNKLMEVCVSKETVFADLAVGVNEVNAMEMKLSHAPEFDALKSLAHGVGQRDLWKKLTVDLRDEVSEALLLQVSQLTTLNDAKSTCKIDASGLTKKSSSAGITIALADGSIANLQLDWKYEGRVFQCLEKKFSIDLRLEVDETDKGVVFKMHILREDRVMESARAAVVDELRAGLPNFVPVYLGRRVS